MTQLLTQAGLAELKHRGLTVIPFSQALTGAMIAEISSYIMGDRNASQDALEHLLSKMTDKVMAYDDAAFIEKFNKGFRIFPPSITTLAIDWAMQLSSSLGARISINYLTRIDLEGNPKLTPDLFDVFWRCVRPGKPDVGHAHSDYQFWEIDKAHGNEAPVPFPYDERLKIWIPLLGCNAKNSLQVIPFSHKNEVPTELVESIRGYKPKIKASWLEGKTFVTPLTTFDHCALLFHDKLVHRAPVNPSEALRISGEFTLLLKYLE